MSVGRTISKIDLVVVSENFGVSYSGGSLATCRLLEHMAPHFNTVTVYCERDDQSLVDHVRIINYQSESEVLEYLNSVSAPTVIYGDFYKCHFVLNTALPFYFSYHDNWPEMLELKDDREQGQSIIEYYQDIFTQAKMIFTVSEYKMPFIRKSTDRVELIRNGITQWSEIKNKASDTEPYRILMAGNISHRKCHHLPEILKQLSTQDLAITIDLYGNIEDQVLYEEINSYELIHHKSYAKSLNYADYDLLLHTSMMENLSLSVVDAIANETPVVAFDVGGLSEVVQDGINGHLVLPYDSTAMTQAIVSAYSHRDQYKFDRDLTTKFNWATSAKKMVDTIYRTNSIQL